MGMKHRVICRDVIINLFVGLLLGACMSTGVSPVVEKPVMRSTPTATLAVEPRVTPLSAEGAHQEAPMPAAPRPLVFPTTVPEPERTWRPPPYPAPWALQPQDHFFFGRPIPSGEVNWPNAQYRYGSTLFGAETLHTGVDMGAERGTQVLAAGPGEVVWAGYGLYRGIEDLTDPYGLAIAIRHDFGYQGQPLYTVYAHLGSISVWSGQRVMMGDLLGTVGETGHATGPHLHFEVRLGENRYFSTRNPELWMVSPEGWGTLAGSVKNSYGRDLHEQLIQIRSLETDKRWDVWTYAEGTVHPDDFYNENFAISDLPAGPYEVRIDFVGRPFTAQFLLLPGRVNFLTFHGRNGFVIEPTPTPADLTRPPSP
jgi:murein DD-endopeptidase MepM/ murein hydrolase activator NlpD